MTAFRYRALNADGSEISGVLEADTTRHARSVLRERGLYPRLIISAHGGPTRVDRRLRLSAGNLVLLTRQWATLVAAGLPIESALTALSEQSEDEKARQVLAAVRAEIVAGHPLSDALTLYPRTFPPIYRALLRAGEKSGRLPQVLADLADYLEERREIVRKVTQALLYPTLVCLAALATLFGLMSYVVPHLVEVFQHNRQTLPALTRLLIFTSDLLRNWWTVMLLALVAVTAIAWKGMRNKAIRRRCERILLRIPVLGPLLRTLDTARFAQTLAILINGGVPLLVSLEAGRDVIRLLPLRDSVTVAMQSVREGGALAEALGRDRQFPPLLQHLIASGESSGKLGPMLERAAHQQRAELENRLGLLTVALEPALVVAMGGMVLLVVLSVLQPIIELNTLMLR